MPSFKNEFYPFGFDKRKAATFYVQYDTKMLNKMDDEMKVDFIKFIEDAKSYLKVWEENMLLISKTNSQSTTPPIQ